MTREDIIRMAREVWSAGDTYIGPSISSLSEFSALVAAAEREACAKVCEEKVERSAGYGGQFEGYGKLTGERTGSECAAAIRAREEE